MEGKQGGGGFKLFYHGVEGKRPGEGVILEEEYMNSVVEAKRFRQDCKYLEIKGLTFNVLSMYAPQVGCYLEEKEDFWSKK